MGILERFGVRIETQKATPKISARQRHRAEKAEFKKKEKAEYRRAFEKESLIVARSKAKAHANRPSFGKRVLAGTAKGMKGLKQIRATNANPRPIKPRRAQPHELRLVLAEPRRQTPAEPKKKDIFEVKKVI